MKFKELPQETQSCAAQTLLTVISAHGVGVCEGNPDKLGEFVATAFIAMERYDSAPVVKIGDSNPT